MNTLNDKKEKAKSLAIGKANELNKVRREKGLSDVPPDYSEAEKYNYSFDNESEADIQGSIFATGSQSLMGTLKTSRTNRSARNKVLGIHTAAARDGDDSPNPNAADLLAKAGNEFNYVQ